MSSMPRFFLEDVFINTLKKGLLIVARSIIMFNNTNFLPILAEYPHNVNFNIYLDLFIIDCNYISVVYVLSFFFLYFKSVDFSALSLDTKSKRGQADRMFHVVWVHFWVLLLDVVGGTGTRNFIFCNFRDNVILSTTFLPDASRRSFSSFRPAHPFLSSQLSPSSFSVASCTTVGFSSAAPYPLPSYIRNLLCALGTLTLHWIAVSGVRGFEFRALGTGSLGFVLFSFRRSFWRLNFDAPTVYSIVFLAFGPKNYGSAASEVICLRAPHRHIACSHLALLT